MSYSYLGVTRSPALAKTASTASLVTTGIGDLVVFICTTASTTIKVTSCAASNVGTFAEMIPGGVTEPTVIEVGQIFWGQTTASSTQTFTPTFNGSITTDNSVCWNLLQFRSTQSNAWKVDTSGSADITTAATATSGVTLAPTVSPRLYVGMISGQTGTNGSTTNFTYIPLDTYTNVIMYNLNVTASVTPTATQSPSSQYLRIAGLFHNDAVASSATGGFFPFMSHHEQQAPGELWKPRRPELIRPRRRTIIDVAPAALAA